jgi:hypothetical protein
MVRGDVSSNPKPPSLKPECSRFKQDHCGFKLQVIAVLGWMRYTLTSLENLSPPLPNPLLQGEGSG